MEIRGPVKVMLMLSSGLLLWITMSLGNFAHAGTVTYVYADQQGTPLAEADTSGNITAAFDYKPYGSLTMGSSPSGPGYTGHVNDADTALIYMKARYYDPVIGRFIGVDPVTFAPGKIFNFNGYNYAANNPIVNTDPDGRECTGSHITDANGNCLSTGTTTTMLTAASVTAVRAFNSGRASYMQYADGAVERRTGSRAWRDNNPGNIRRGGPDSLSRKSALGWDYSPSYKGDHVTAKDPYAIFGSVSIGRVALSDWLSNHGTETISQAISHYAPLGDANNPAKYSAFVRGYTGTAESSVINSLTPSQRDGFMKAIEIEEAFTRGGSASIIYSGGLGPFSQ